jgi:hypothetical protein
VNVRIVIERGEGDVWFWRLTAFGDEVSGHGEPPLVTAAEQASHCLGQMDRSRRLRKQRTAWSA